MTLSVDGSFRAELHNLYVLSLSFTFSSILFVTTQGKTLVTSALYLKRTSHNWGSLQLLIKS